MQTLFAVPMRNNNNNLLDSGRVFLSDWVTVALLGGVHIRIDCASIDVDAEIVVNYAMFSGGIETGSGGNIYSTAGKHEIVFSRGDFDNGTEIQGTIQTVGQARFSLELLSSAQGEDIPDDGWWPVIP